MYLGFGINSDTPLDVKSHLTIRDEKTEKIIYRAKLKKLRYIFKGDVAIIRDLINQFWVARFYYGVNNLLRSMDEFKE